MKNDKSKKDEKKQVAEKLIDEEAEKKKESMKGHRERIRRRFRDNGFELDDFKDYEVLELMLYYILSQKDTKQIAKDLIDRFISISGVLNADPHELSKVYGLGKESVIYIKFLKELIKRYMTDNISKENTITSHEEAINYFKGRFWGEKRECIYIVCMGNDGKVLYFRRIADGEPDSVNVVPTDIVKIALRADAVRVVLAHNHPSGICVPSSQDLRVTSIISDELYRVGVELFDHIIFAPNGEYSMRDKGMLPSRM